MKFLCDVHIPLKLVKFLQSKGFEAIHVNSMPNKWYTRDQEIIEYANSNCLVLISKDGDFRNSFILNGDPKRLIKINSGNISNQTLISIFEKNIDAITKLDIYPSFMVEVHDIVTVVLP